MGVRPKNSTFAYHPQVAPVKLSGDGTCADHRYDVYTPEGRLDYEVLRSAALDVARQFPLLSASAFFAEIQSRFYPRPTECDIKGLVLELISAEI